MDGALDADMHACITKVFKSWKFPKPKDGKPVKVKTPLDFSPI